MAQQRPTLQSTPPQPQAPTPQLAKPPGIATVKMFTGWTIALLVLLRIFIGWHFFVEGVWKLSQPEWRATSYLVASAGPMRDSFRKLVPDVDGREVLAIDGTEIRKGTELTGEKAEALKTELSKRLQARLDAMFDETVEYYDLDANQKNLAKNVFAAQQLKLTQLCDDKDFIAHIWDYKILLDEIDTQEQKVVKEPKSASMEFEKQRLTDMYKRKASEKSELVGKAEKPINDLPSFIYKTPGLLTEAQLQTGYMETDSSPTWPIDWANMIGLTVVGVCLILGLFTRLACLGAAGLLAMYYLSMPALPGLPEAPGLEGHYLIINKNLIELVTVLMLATTRVGRWGGLDALIARKAKPAV